MWIVYNAKLNASSEAQGTTSYKPALKRPQTDTRKIRRKAKLENLREIKENQTVL